MDGLWFLYLLLAAFPALIIFAAVYKFMEVAQARTWSSTPGKVVLSTSEMRDVKTSPGSDDRERRTFAKIVYQYKVADQTYRCDRVSIGEDLGNFEVAETIARYPVGKAVTVYYNPSKRSQAVLERDPPPGIVKALVIFVLGYAAIAIGLVFGFGWLGTLMRSLVPDPKQAPFVTACIGFAAFTGLFVYAFQRRGNQMARWPTVPGQIDTAEMITFVDERGKTMYRPEVLYSYEVAGVRYSGNTVGTGATTRANSPKLVKVDPRYTPGLAVTIHYNPENPAEAILDPNPRRLWLLWLIPAAVLALAFIVARSS